VNELEHVTTVASPFVSNRENNKGIER